MQNMRIILNLGINVSKIPSIKIILQKNGQYAVKLTTSITKMIYVQYWHSICRGWLEMFKVNKTKLYSHDAVVGGLAIILYIIVKWHLCTEINVYVSQRWVVEKGECLMLVVRLYWSVYQVYQLGNWGEMYLWND